VTPLPEPSAGPLSVGLSIAICTLSRPDSVRRVLHSIAGQTRQADEILVIDASRDEATETVVRQMCGAAPGFPRLVYARVTGARVGLTRQRNLALALASRDLVAFFDDDVVLEPGCLVELEQPHRASAGIAGVGGMLAAESAGPSAIWRLRRLLGIVSNLSPGRYHRSGMSTPWSLATQREGLLEGDWLPGFAMMWNTQLAREVGFYEAFAGYGQAEDLEFSLRAARRGKVLMACGARVRDDHALEGRPDPFRLGYMAIHNRYIVHRRGLKDRTGRDTARFIYAWLMDTFLLLRHLLFPSRWRSALLQIGGRLKAGFDLAQNR
jgi:GT2 family glycosyltransferase